MRTQYLHDTVYDNTYRVTSATSEGVYIFTATRRKKHAMAGPPYNKERGQYGHFVNFLEEIYQEIFLDVSSPLITC